MECSVCCNSVSSKKIVECNYCDHTACKDCVKTYLTSVEKDACCMSCDHAWNRDQLINKISNSFVNNEYKKHRENVLFNIEKSLMPSTQAHVELYRKKKVITDELNEIKRIQKELNTKKNSLNSQLHELVLGSGSKNKSMFVRKCPMEDCRGFLSSTWKCGTCDTQICKECNDELTETHVCNEETKQTMKLLAKDTKPCPSCGCMIHKLVGCDQMYCVECNTAFSWRTGVICNGAIHNPHYFEYQTQQNANRRTFGDFECGGLPSAPFAVRQYAFKNDMDLLYALRWLMHIEAVSLPQFRTDLQTSNLQSRITYMIGNISESMFKKDIQRKEKQRLFHKDIYDVYEMVHTVCAEYMREACEINKNTHYKINEIKDKLSSIESYANTAFDDIKKRYSSKMNLKLEFFRK